MLETLWALLAIILIDIVLAGDNALVIGMAANRLPDHLKKKAIFWGTFGAIGIRFVSILGITYLLMIPGLRLMGGLLLLYIAWHLAFKSDDTAIEAKQTFWAALSTIIIADAVMGIDNALGIAAAANGNFLMVIFGLVISIPIILFGSNIIAKFLEKYPNAIFIGSYVLFLVGLKMIFTESFVDKFIDPMHDWSESALPWLVALVLTAKQFYRSRIKKV